jgi:AcrR family transcriptional regulator
MLKLLEEKPLAKITVKEICQEAQINRATFYKHYDNPYDLLDKMMQELLDQLEDRITQAKPRDFKDVFCVVLTDIQEKYEYYQLLFSTNGDEKFRDRLFTLCYGDNIRTIQTLFPELPLVKQEWLYFFMAEGSKGILMNWIQHGRKESIQEVADFAGNLIYTLNDHFKG